MPLLQDHIRDALHQAKFFFFQNVKVVPGPALYHNKRNRGFDYTNRLTFLQVNVGVAVQSQGESGPLLEDLQFPRWEESKGAASVLRRDKSASRECLERPDESKDHALHKSKRWSPSGRHDQAVGPEFYFAGRAHFQSQID